MPDGDALYPNNLRSIRDTSSLTRAQLAALCAKLAEEDSIRYTAVGESTIKHIELGGSQPRASTAATLAKALGQVVSAIFPNGIDTKNRLRASESN